MTELDDQLREELLRRSKSVSHSSEWARHDLLPAVSAGIDTRPQRVAASRWPAFAGLAGAVTILAVLVLAMPRMTPGPQPSGSTEPVASVAAAVTPRPATAAYSAAEFGQLFAAGEMDGRTVLVDARIRPFDGDFTLYGRVCEEEPSFPPRADPGGDCVMGRLDGAAPDVWVNAPYLADSPGVLTAWAWRAATPPIEGRLLLEVSEAGFVEFLGVVDAEIRSVATAKAINIESMGLEDIVLVEGWLWTPEGPGVDISIDCVTPPARIAELPSRWCQPMSSLISKYLAAGGGLTSDIDSLHVQRSAYFDFGVFHEGPPSVFAMAPRLYGECMPEPPCWEWDVVARLDPGTAETPEPTNQPGPPASPGLPLPTPSASGCQGIVEDETGLIAGCESSGGPDGTAAPISVTNPGGDQHILDVTWATVCEVAGRFTFRGSEGGFELLAYSDQPMNVFCDGFPRGHNLRLHVRQPIAAESVQIALVPSGIWLCAPEGGQGDGEGSCQATLHDETGLVSGPCRVQAPSEATLSAVNPEGDRTVLQLNWAGSPCDLDLDVTFSQVDDGYRADVQEDSSCVLSHAVRRSLVIFLHGEVDATTVDLEVHGAL